jgi:hypothetical protein
VSCQLSSTPTLPPPSVPSPPPLDAAVKLAPMEADVERRRSNSRIKSRASLRSLYFFNTYIDHTNPDTSRVRPLIRSSRGGRKGEGDQPERESRHRLACRLRPSYPLWTSRRPYQASMSQNVSLHFETLGCLKRLEQQGKGERKRTTLPF